MEEVKLCPRDPNHGPLRRDGDEAKCIMCGYEKPLQEHGEPPIRQTAPPERRARKKRCNYQRYPEVVKIKAVADIMQGVKRDDICKRVGCSKFALRKWKEKYRDIEAPI